MKGGQGFERATPSIGAGDRVVAPVPRISIHAFCESPDTSEAIAGAAADRRMEKASVKVQMGGSLAALEAFQNAPTPNLIFIESSANRASLIQQLDSLAEFCDSGTKVIVASRVNDIILYRELVARGVSDYMVAPFSIIDFISSVSALYSVEGAKFGRIVSVIGAKGGVGASTIAHNVAWSSASVLDVATIIADLDLGFGTASLDFNNDPTQNITEALLQPERVDMFFLDKLLTKCGDKLSLLAAPSVLTKSFDLPETAMASLSDLLRASAPLTVLDMPNTWNGWTRRTLIGSDEVVIVAEPDLASLRNAKNIMDALRSFRKNDSIPHLVLNKTGVPKRSEIPVSDFAKAVGVEPLAVIGFNAQLFGNAANNGQMLSEIDPNHATAMTMTEIASIMNGRTDSPKPKKSTFLQPFMEKLIKRN